VLAIGIHESLATSQYALLFTIYIVGPDEALSGIFRVHAASLAIMCVIVVVPINLLYLLVGIPRWLRHGLPSVPSLTQTSARHTVSPNAQVQAPRQAVTM